MIVPRIPKDSNQEACGSIFPYYSVSAPGVAGREGGMKVRAVADTVEGQETPKLFVFYWHFGCLLLGRKTRFTVPKDRCTWKSLKVDQEDITGTYQVILSLITRDYRTWKSYQRDPGRYLPGLAVSNVHFLRTVA